MTDGEPDASLKDLDARIKKARGTDEPRARGKGDGRALGQAMRLAVELVVGIAVGSALGLFLDRWLGTAPWLFLVFFPLGAAAGFANVLRAAKRMKTGGEDGRD